MIASERNELLAAIKARPLEDTPRLMYADHIEEYPETGFEDRDRATAEFIRMTCDCTNRGKKAISASAGKWLHNHEWESRTKVGNWGRLVPQLADWCARVNLRHSLPNDLLGVGYPIPEVWYTRDGRIIKLHYKRAWPLPDIFELEFWRGFVRKVRVPSWEHFDLVLPRLMHDQPLLEPELKNENYLQSFKERGSECWGGPRSAETVLWSHFLHPGIFSYITSPKMPELLRGKIVGGDCIAWYGDNCKERARWATVIGFRQRALEILSGETPVSLENQDPFATELRPKASEEKHELDGK